MFNRSALGGGGNLFEKAFGRKLILQVCNRKKAIQQDTPTKKKSKISISLWKYVFDGIINKQQNKEWTYW